MKGLIRRRGDRVFCDRYCYNDIEYMSRKFRFPSNKRILLSESNGIQFLSKLLAIWEVNSTPVLLSPKLNPAIKNSCVQMIDGERVPDEAMIVFTSATSSMRPKGVILTNSNLENHLNMLNNHVSHHFLSKDDRTTSILPWTHCYGLMGECFSMMERHGHMVTGNYLFSAQLHQPTILFVVPKVLEKLLDMNKKLFFLSKKQRRRILFGPKIRFIVSGGSFLPQSLIDEFVDEFNVDIYQGYGCSEMSPMISLETEIPNTQRMKMIDGIDIKIQDDGELFVNGLNRFYGYVGAPKLENDEYYKTGDVGRLDQDRLILCRRKSSTVKLRNGYFIDLDEKEKELLKTTGSSMISLWESEGDLRGIVYQPKVDLRFFPFLKEIKYEPTIENDLLTVKREAKRSKMIELYGQLDKS